MIIKNLYTYIHTYIHTKKEKKRRKSEGNTTLSIYSKEDYKKFRQILDVNDDSVSSFLDDVIQIILEQYDLKAHSLDKYLDEIELLLPTIDTDPEKILKFLLTKDMETVKKYEAVFQQIYTYTLAITQGEKDFSNYPYLWRKYKWLAGLAYITIIHPDILTNYW